MSTEKKSGVPALPDDLPEVAGTRGRGSGESSGGEPRGTEPIGDSLGWSSLTEQDLDDIFGYEGPNGWVDSKIKATAEQRALIDSWPDDPKETAAIKAILDGTDGIPKPATASTNESQESYPEGWWVPAQRSWQMAVRGSPTMTATEYRKAFLQKLCDLMHSEGREEARSTILSFFDPYNREEYFPEDGDFWDWATSLMGLLAFPLASPEDSEPAPADEAHSAVEAQEELSLSEVLSAGIA